MNAEATTCFVDLGNIGRAYSLLAKRIAGQNHNVFDYQSFEQLVYESDLVRGSRDVESFDYTTIEMMYEKLLEKENIGYKHSKPLIHNFNRSVDYKHRILLFLEQFGTKNFELVWNQCVDAPSIYDSLFQFCSDEYGEFESPKTVAVF